MQLLAYLSTLGLEGVLEEPFDKELAARQDTVLGASDPAEAIQGDAREANAKVMQVLVLGFKKPDLVNTIVMSSRLSGQSERHGECGRRFMTDMRRTMRRQRCQWRMSS